MSEPAKKVEIIEAGAALVPSSGNVLSPMEMLQSAIERGVAADVLGKLMDLAERWDKTQARKAFDEALAAARGEFKPIAKNRQVGFDSKKPGASRTDYKHEDLAEIARTVDPVLAKHGLSYRFRTSSEPNEPIMVTCIISHRLGHSEENTLRAGRDDSGNKNPIQSIGSAITYLQRYTLKAALGLAASNDDDGKASGNGETISQEQALAIGALIKETKANTDLFCTYMKVECIEDIRAKDFDRAVKALEAKKAKQ